MDKDTAIRAFLAWADDNGYEWDDETRASVKDSFAKHLDKEEGDDYSTVERTYGFKIGAVLPLAFDRGSPDLDWDQNGPELKRCLVENLLEMSTDYIADLVEDVELIEERKS